MKAPKRFSQLFSPDVARRGLFTVSNLHNTLESIKTGIATS